MKVRAFFAPLYTVIAFALSAAIIPAHAQKSVRQVEIHSGWGGLGTPRNADVVIHTEKAGFVCNGKPVAPALINALVAALDTPRIPKPEIENLGLSQAWLKDNLAPVENEMQGAFPNALASQRTLFESTFTDQTDSQDSPIAL